MKYKFYNGDQDPRLMNRDIQDQNEADKHSAVECADNECGLWRGNLLHDGQCPKCGSATISVDEAYFDKESEKREIKTVASRTILFAASACMLLQQTAISMKEEGAIFGLGAAVLMIFIFGYAFHAYRTYNQVGKS